MVVLNFTDAPAELPIEEPVGPCVLSTREDIRRGVLQASEGRIYLR